VSAAVVLEFAGARVAVSTGVDRATLELVLDALRSRVGGES
jgi:hypothetical protein